MTIPLHTFDVAYEMKTSFLLGDILGSYAQSIFKGCIERQGADSVWNIDFRRSAATDYRFVSSFLSPILDDYGTVLPSNVAVSISCRTNTDRKHILQGLAWNEGNFEVPKPDAVIERISFLHRYVVLFMNDKFEYIGTDEEHFTALIQFAETKDELVFDDVRATLGWEPNDIVERFQELHKRRQIVEVSRGKYKLISGILSQGGQL